ncbi:MAG TPA: polysaccharide deacetylase family protein, partial [Candidatus Acidoferrum sp.]
MKERGPIFYDAERVRWRRTRRVLEITAILLTVSLAYFFVTIAVSVDLPAGLLPDTRPGFHPLKLKPNAKLLPVREGRRRRVANIGSVPASYDPLRAAFFVSWDPNSLASLKAHYKEIDLLIPAQVHSVTADGALTVIDYENAQNTFKTTPAGAIAVLKEDKLHQWMKSLNLEMPTMGLLDNYDGVNWHVKELADMLANPAARHNLERDLLEYATKFHESGIVVDFEEVPDDSQQHFKRFAAELANALHSANLKLMIALPARDEDYDYRFFGKQCDAIVLMNYDQHWLTSPPGPIAAQEWYVENLRQVLKEVPAQKIIAAVGNYAYDWSLAPKKKPEPAESLTIQEALLRASESETDIEFDATSLNPHYSYNDQHEHVHQVWMLDALTAYNELRANERLGVQGTALWRLGSADTSMWPIWDATRPTDAIRAKITDLPPGPDLIFEGDGDIWHFIDTPKHGRRSFTYDAASDLFTGEKYEAYPLSYHIDQLGAAKKKLAITFDDGPDPRWTPKILDILKEKKVPATFFVVGVAGSQYPQILKREYAEGHEVGNHTYTHPNFEEISHTQLRWELNLTQRLIESTLGVKSILFRPPYGIDHQPEYAEEVSQLPIAQDMGYVIVGQKVDPHDWKQPNGKQVPAADIVDGVLSQASEGNIILFHDGAGDRAQT